MQPDILMYSTAACPYCIVAKRALDKAGLKYKIIDITRTPQVRDELHAKTGERTVPQIFVDGAYIGQDDELVEMIQSGKLTADAKKKSPEDAPLATDADADTIDVAIIGAGWSGLTLARNLPKNLSVTLFDRTPHADGLRPDRDTLRQTLTERGARFVEREVFGIENGADGIALVTLDGPIAARSVVVASGARAHAADIPGEADLLGKGVSMCAECDGAFFTDRTVAVAGNDERALKAVSVIAEKARTVYLLCPTAALFAGDAATARLNGLKNVTVQMSTDITRIDGESQVSAVHTQNGVDAATLAVDGVFIYLQGETPATSFLKGAPSTDNRGAVLVSGPGQSAVDGIYAVGPASNLVGGTPPYGALAMAIAEQLG